MNTYSNLLIISIFFILVLFSGCNYEVAGTDGDITIEDGDTESDSSSEAESELEDGIIEDGDIEEFDIEDKESAENVNLCNPDPCSGIPNMICDYETGGCICKDNYCTIDNACIPNGDANTDHVCLYCNVEENLTDWSLRPSNYECRTSTGICDAAEVCDGTSNDCPSDAKLTTECRPSIGICDIAEVCDGTNNDCPADAKLITECRPSVGICDIAESCDGTNNDCPADAKLTTECRPSIGICDTAEVCDGTNNDCPEDIHIKDGNSCDDGENCTDNDICTNGICSGSTYSCNNNGTCNSNNNICSCTTGFAGDYCDQCAKGYINYPNCRKNIQIVAGKGYTCVLLENHSVKCWGNNTDGQLGDGTTEDKIQPTQVSGLDSGVAAISATYEHTCALLEDGSVKCWGLNFSGQLGDGTTENRSQPTQVSGLDSGVVTVSTGANHTCAILENRSLKCWGNNFYGKLGDGTTEDKVQPTQVSGMDSGVVDVFLGNHHTCALLENGSLRCWGNNDLGQLGDGTLESKSLPIQVSGLNSGVVDVSSGALNTCALLENGSLKCWGNNDYGQLGNGTNIDKSQPTQVSGMDSGVVDVSATGLGSICAILEDGSLKCWGRNHSGQLGDGTKDNQNLPTQVFGLGSGIVAVSTGQEHTCAVLENETFKCWGDNNCGQLGDGRITNKSLPTQVLGLDSGIVTISAGGNHTCAILENDALKCWGSNSSSQLGNGTTTSAKSLPVLVSRLDSAVTDISLGHYHTCAIFEGGALKCWGNNTDGELGDGTTTYKTHPTQVVWLDSGVVDVSSGGYHTCAVLAGGALKCWGRSNYGQLGNGIDNTTDNATIPIQVLGLNSGVVTVSSGDHHTCAILEGGALECWGHNLYGQLGDGTTENKNLSTQVSGLNSGVVAVSSGLYRTCAILEGGVLKCWGRNNYGQLGDGTTENKKQPTQVFGLESGVIAVSVGYYHTCALLESGTLQCWGRNSNGQLGDGTTIDKRLPTQVSGLNSIVVAVSTRGNHTCALLANGSLKCWGNNTDGQLGESELWLPEDVILE